MPFVRPIVYVYQEFANVVVAPAVPDLNCCLVGPCFHIEDYPTDKTDIYAVDFIKTGQTKDAACAADGSSGGRPDAGTTFVTLTEPSAHTSGGELDADSVDVVFDEALIELNFGDDGAIVDDTNVFTAATHGDFVNKKVVAGDRIVLTDTTGAIATIVKYVKAVTDGTHLELTSTKKSTELIGNSAIRWRVEHALVDQHIDKDLYVVVVSNTISINTTPTCILLAYEDLTWKVNYAKIYVGYRELRTDLQDVKVLDNSDAIEALLGTVDERNPLAVGAQTAFTNTNTPIQVFGVGADTLVGQTSARDRMTTRDDIYALVPLTDSLSGADWVSVIALWKSHCYAFSDPSKSKFRIVIGSYDILPSEKASAPASTFGYTEIALPLTPNVDVDVFIDPHASTEFVTKGVGSAHLLDITHASALTTVDNGKNIFTVDSPVYSGGKTLLGAMGEKRLRAGAVFATAEAALRCDYFVRAAILASEGGTAVASADECEWTSSDAGATTTITKTGGTAFSTCQAGDIVHVTGGATATHNDGFLVLSKTADTVKINLAYGADVNTGSIDVKVYRPVVGVTDATWTNDHTITKTGGFTGAAIGDLAIITPEKDGDTDNRGMWVVTAADANSITLATDGTYKLVDPSTAIMNVAIFHTKASHGVAGITTRARLTRLRDNTASFLTTVKPDELIEIPYPAVTTPTLWDTAKTSWPIDEVVSNELLKADLEPLEELGPKAFIAGFTGDCSYRIAITLDKTAQVEELNTITTSLKNMRCVMVWPNSVLLPTEIKNNLTGIRSAQSGQYLACTVGGLVAGLPSQQGFTYIGVGGIAQLNNSNFYFNDDQLTALRNGGWYVFVQDGESSLPYTIHEVTTDVSAYEFGELMHVKNFDYIANSYKVVLQEFLGRYNILPETISTIVASLESRSKFLRARSFPKIGPPLLDAVIGLIEQSEADMLEVYMEIDMPNVLNKIGLHLKA